MSYYNVFLIVALSAGSCYSYQAGTSYVYSFTSDVLIADAGNSEKAVGTSINSKFTVAPIWSKEENSLFKLQVNEFSIKSKRSTKSNNFPDILKFPTYFLKSSGKVKKVFVRSDQESVQSLNLKNGFASLFQYQTTSKKASELDVSGQCDVEYLVAGSTITKEKSGCSNLNIMLLSKNNKELLDTDRNSSVKSVYHIKDDVIQEIKVTEKHNTVISVMSSVGSIIENNQQIKLESTSTENESLTGATMEEAVKSLNKMLSNAWIPMLPISEREESPLRRSAVKVVEVVKRYRDLLIDKENIGHIDMSRAFMELVASFKQADKDAIRQVLRSNENDVIQMELVDAITASETGEGLEVLQEFLKFGESDDSNLQERFLMAVSFTTKPSEEVVNYIFDILKKDLADGNVKVSSALALGAVLSTYSKNEDTSDPQFVQDVLDNVLKYLTNCEDSSCKILYLNVLQNAALPQSLPTLIDLAVKGDKLVSLAALKSIQRIDKGSFSFEIRKSINSIYHQTTKKYNTSVRYAALAVLLSLKPSANELRCLILAASSSGETQEFTTFVLARIFDFAKFDVDFKKTLKLVMNDPQINNYYFLPRFGMSTAYTGLFTEFSNSSTHYSLFMESNDGVVSNSISDVYFKKSGNLLPIMTSGLYTDGMESMMGSDAPEGVEPTTGMWIDLFGVSLRPIQFFYGQSDLMSAVWSAPDTLTSALQGNILLNNHNRPIHLQNGLIVVQEIQSSLSMDTSGMISISIWNKNAHTVVKNSAAFSAHGTAELISPLISAGLDFTADVETFISVITDVDFYEMPMGLCIQMEHPHIILSTTSVKYERLRTERSGYRHKHSRHVTYPGSSFPFHQNNNVLCKVMLNQDDDY